MISRFFKKKPKPSAPKKSTPAEKPKSSAPAREKTLPPQRLLTAEGWKRLMMRKMKK